MTSILSVTIETDDLAGAVMFWRSVLNAAEPAVLSWAPGAGSAFFELENGTRLIVSAPRRSSERTEWLGLELHTDDPDHECERLRALGVPVSEGYDTDGGSRACVVTSPEGQKFRLGTRWPLPTADADLSKTSPQERTLS